MRFLKLLKEWLFYGHIWIALGAASLGLVSKLLAGPLPEELRGWYLEAFLFFATLGVYTLHRLLSFRRASSLPSSKRYRLVSLYPIASVIIGVAALAISSRIIYPFIGILWPNLLISGSLTVFYLTPPFPGWRRLRDFPYVKVVWVAVTWVLLTHGTVVTLQIEPSKEWPGWVSQVEYLNRFCFILIVALLFDLRDVALDQSQGVKTVANTYGEQLKTAVYLLAAVCIIITLSYAIADTPLALFYAFVMLPAYIASFPVARTTFTTTREDWYAISVNGLLVIPGFLFFVVLIFSKLLIGVIT